MQVTPGRMRFFLNIYPPYLGTGIRIGAISDDWRYMKVCMKMHWYNRNYVGTHFGGSLFSMTDPHYMLLLMNILGRGYIVWDKAASIDFISPGRGTLTAEFRISDADLEDIYQATAGGQSYLKNFKVSIEDAEGQRVAAVEKTLYIRKKTR